MQDKKVLIRLYALSLPLIFYRTKYELGKKTAHTLITKNLVGKALFYKSMTKSPEHNMSNL